MNLLPDIKITKGVGSNGLEYVHITRHWLWWSKTLCRIPVGRLWPSDIIVLPKSTLFPQQPIPTNNEKKLVTELMETRGYKVLKKFWIYQALVLAHGCTKEIGNIKTIQGLFQGFLQARETPFTIAHWGEGVARGEELEEEESMYQTQARMDREAPQEY